MAEKEAEGIAEKRSGAQRMSVLALTGTRCALWGVVVPALEVETGLLRLYFIGLCSSFSTKLSDTCASEVGKAHGKRTFLITTLQPVSRGTEGAVSLEGTLAGVVASAAIALVGWGRSDRGVVFMLAAFIAHLESVIGATLQAKVGWLHE